MSTFERAQARFIHRLSFVLGLACTVGWPIDAHAQVTRVSVASDGAQANGASRSAAMSADGRFVTFASLADNLVPGDTNAVDDVFVHDRATGQTTRVSVGSAGAQADASSHEPDISADGRFVVFQSQANLDVATGRCSEPFCSDIYIHDRSTGQTSRVSVSGSGEPPNGGSENAVISADGRVVAFLSRAENLTPDSNGRRDLFVRDLVAGVTTNVTARAPVVAPVPPAVTVGFGVVGRPALSGDGRFVAYASEQANIVPGDTNTSCVLDYIGFISCTDVFVFDRQTASTIRASVNTAGSQLVYGGYGPTLSADGRYVAFLSPGPDPDIASGPPCIVRGASAVFVRDLLSSRTSVVAASGSGCGTVAYFNSHISQDGRFISFDGPLPGLGGDTGVFVYDQQSKVSRQASLAGVSTQPIGGDSLSRGVSADGRFVLFESTATNLIPNDTNTCGAGAAIGTCSDVFVRDMFDDDGDTMTNEWETFFGLSPVSAADAALDLDTDGRTNAQEFAAGTHPRGLAGATRYFAEGAATNFFDTRIAVANPSSTATASVLLRFLKPDGSSATQLVALPPLRSRQILADTLPAVAGWSFASIVESDAPVVADRLMWWGPEGAYGTHSEHSVSGPALTWHFAEGATHSGFDLFYLVLNPNPTPSSVRVRYLLPSGAPLVRTYSVPANSRFNIWVDQELFNGVAALAATDVSTAFEVQNGVPVMVERAMYLSTPGGPPFSAGHASAGATALSPTWFFAEGATGSFFDEYVLIANPGTSAATVRATYLLNSGATYTKTYTVPAGSRFNIWVDDETIPGQGKPLADAALSVRLEVTSGPPVVAERSMWWPGPSSATWLEAHNVLGSTVAAPRWAFAEGAVSGAPGNTDTYLLISNATAGAATVKVTLLFGDATAAPSKTYTVAATSRFNVNVRAEFPGALDKGFGAIVESIDTPAVPIVVERAVYNDANGVHWAAGTAALGTPIP